jgi:DNA primase
VRFRVERILADDDRSSPEGRDRILGRLRPIFASIGPGAMREELEREVTARLSVSEATVARVLGGPARGAARAPADGGAELAVAKLGAIERTERTFLEMCLALPDYGSRLLAEIDIDAVFGSPLARAAARRLLEHPDAPAHGVADPALAALLAELSVRAAALAPVPAQLEVERRQLELARVDRAIAGAREGGSGRLSALGRERAEVKRELDTWIDRVLVEQGVAAD